MKGEVTVYKKL